MNAKTLPLLLLLSAVFGILCAYAAADRSVFATAPSGGRDALIVAHHVSGDASVIERWDPEERRKIAEVHVNGTVVSLLCIGARMICSSRHDILVGPANLSSPPKPVWHIGRDILRVAPFHRGILVLVVNDADAVHPLSGQVYWFLGPDSKPRLLSLRSIYNFWDIQSGDIDGDGRPVIALCTWSKTRYVHEYARRYFIYGMTNRDTYPRWRGSRLSKPYIEARLVRAGAGQNWKLFSAEQVNANHVCLMLYKWDDFGFFGIGRSADLSQAALIRNDYSVPLARASTAHGEDLVEAVVENDALRLEHICSISPGDSVVVGKFRGKNVSALIVPAGGVKSSSVYELTVYTK